MERRWRGWQSGWLAMGMTMPVAAFGASAPLVHHTFEDGVGRWMAMGPSSKVALTREAPHVKEGKAGLQYDYSVAKGEMGALLLPMPDGALAKAKAVRFWVRADAATTLVVALQEKQGGRYSA